MKYLIHVLILFSCFSCTRPTISPPAHQINSKIVSYGLDISQEYEFIGRWDVLVALIDMRYTFELYCNNGDCLGVMLDIPNKPEVLIRVGDKYFVENRRFEEYYKIEDGRLRFYGAGGIVEQFLTKPI